MDTCHTAPATRTWGTEGVSQTHAQTQSHPISTSSSANQNAVNRKYKQPFPVVSVKSLRFCCGCARCRAAIKARRAKIRDLSRRPSATPLMRAREGQAQPQAHGAGTRRVQRSRSRGRPETTGARAAAAPGDAEDQYRPASDGRGHDAARARCRPRESTTSPAAAGHGRA
ncbi:unnamed protein product [Arctogadus glacialis]